MSMLLAAALSVLSTMPGPDVVSPPRAGVQLVQGVQTRFFQKRIPICRGGRRVTCVVDGDTLWLEGEKIRVMGIDTPEVGRTAKCRKEKEIGRVATERFAEIVSSGGIELRRRGQDRYKRTLAYVLVDGQDAGEILLREGLAVRYEGRSTAEPWCR